MKPHILRLTGVVTLTLFMGTLAVAHQGATGVVKERMDQMGGVAKAMKALGAMFKGEQPYDAEAARALSSTIAASSGSELSVLFPKHSMDPPTEARHEIWTDWDKFSSLADEMQASALALAKGAANPADGSAGPKPVDLFRELAGTCKACHQDFRIKK